MSIYVNSTFRIRRSASQQEDMQKLTGADIFDGYKDILMISAIIGYNHGLYAPIEKAASDGVLMQFFSQKDYDIMDLIAYSHAKEQSVLKSDEKYDIFSAYANGGFPVLLSKLKINDLDNITQDDARKAQSRYYSLLLSGEFEPEEVNDSDLLI